MAKLITLTEDGPLGVAGKQVWVDDDYDEQQTATPKPRKATAPAKKSVSD